MFEGEGGIDRKEEDMKAMVSMIVGRCHVGESYRSVIRYVISRLKGGYEAFRSAPREERRMFIGWIVEEHRKNRKLYREVMSGGFGYPYEE